MTNFEFVLLNLFGLGLLYWPLDSGRGKFEPDLDDSDDSDQSDHSIILFPETKIEGK